LATWSLSWLLLHTAALGARYSEQSVAVQPEHAAAAVGGRDRSKLHFLSELLRAGTPMHRAEAQEKENKGCDGSGSLVPTML